MSKDVQHEVIIHGLTMDPKNNSPVLLLREKDGNRGLPIWIGLFEANSIAIHLGEMESPRPLTHDLMIEVLLKADLKIQKVAVTELRDNTFYARIVLSGGGQNVELDSRPSDAIALAVRARCPIYVSEDVLNQSSVDMSMIDIRSEEGAEDEWADLLEQMNPEDFSKYKM